MKKCLHQICRPKIKWHEYGVGDCTVCKPDKNNKLCKWYYPIAWTTIKIEERGNE